MSKITKVVGEITTESTDKSQVVITHQCANDRKLLYVQAAKGDFLWSFYWTDDLNHATLFYRSYWMGGNLHSKACKWAQKTRGCFRVCPVAITRKVDLDGDPDA